MMLVTNTKGFTFVGTSTAFDTRHINSLANITN